MVKNVVENFVRESLDDSGNRRTFAANMQVRIRNLRAERKRLFFINLKSIIYNEYHSCDLPSTVTDEGLASIILIRIFLSWLAFTKHKLLILLSKKCMKMLIVLIEFCVQPTI